MIGAALYAVFPMAVVTNRTLWNPAAIPFFATLAVLALVKYAASRNPWMLALVLFALSALLQIHASGVVLIAVVGGAIMLYRLPVRPGPVVAGCLLGALFFVPWVIAQLQTQSTGLSNALGWMGASRAGHLAIARGAVLVPVEAPVRSSELAGGPLTGILELAGLAELSLLAVALLIAGYRSEWKPTILLRLWWVLPLLLFPFNQHGVPLYYFDISYPSQFLLIGALVNVVGPRARTAITTLAALICAVQMTFNVTFAHTLRADGVIRTYLGDAMLNSSGDRTRVEAMTIGQARGLARAFATELGSGAREYLSTHAHGPLYEQFREGKGIMIDVFAEGRPARPTGMHYWIARCTAQMRTRRALVAGDMCIIPYSPRVDPSGWEVYTDEAPAGWPAREAAGRPVTLPANVLPSPDEWAPIPVYQWDGSRVWLQGRLVIERPLPRAPVGVLIRDWPHKAHRVTGLLVNGVAIPLPPERHYGSQLAPIFEVSADVAPYLRAGTNTMGVVVEGESGSFDLDVYDVPEGF